MSDSIESAALGVAWQIVMKRNFPPDTPEEKLIDSTVQTAVRLSKAYRAAVSAVNLTPDYSDLLRKQRGPASE